jgi:uncharacterized protein YbjT (DUF2867 family)
VERIRKKHMKIVIVGGTGLIGSKAGWRLREGGHEVVVAALSSGVNAMTGEGLAQAFAGADVVIDVTNPKSFEDDAILGFFKKSSRNLLAAEARAGVRHHVSLGIVGTERLQASGYLRGKLVQETLIRDSGNSYTIIHSTQFFELMPGIADLATVGQEVRLPTAFVQPISADEVANAVSEIALGPPAAGIIEIAGPERGRLNEFVTRFLSAIKDKRVVVPDPEARYFGAELGDQSLLPGDKARIGTTIFQDWLLRRG